MGFWFERDSVQALAFSDLGQVALYHTMGVYLVDDAEVPGWGRRGNFR
jgi:hypothetical protein